MRRCLTVIALDLLATALPGMSFGLQYLNTMT
jgi:hypothetical protein